MFFDPNLQICGGTIPFAGNSDNVFLGLHIDLSLSPDRVMDSIVCKLEDLCHKVDVSPFLTRQKLKVYNLGICPRLAWLLSLQDVSTTWVERSVEAIATRYLKRWCRLSRSADVSRLYLPHTSGGLQLRAISSL